MAKKSKNPTRKDLKELQERQKYLTDKSRAKAVEKRHLQGKRTARENIEDLCDSVHPY